MFSNFQRFAFSVCLLLQTFSRSTAVLNLGCDAMDPLSFEHSKMNSNEPYWGKAIQNPTVFTDVNSLKSFVGQLKNVIQEEITETLYDNIHSFIELYEVYDARRNYESFKKFFNKWQPTFSNSKNGITLVVKVLNQIVSSLNLVQSSNIRNGVFMGAGIVYPSKNVLENVKKSGPPKVSTYLFVPGVIKFCLNGTRIGYIFFEPEIIFETAEPIIVMEDGQFPQTRSAQFEDKIIEFYISPENKNYILSRSNDRWSTDFLIFVGRPYCSILDRSLKYSILEPFKCLIKRDEQGNGVAGIYVNALPQYLLRNSFFQSEASSSSSVPETSFNIFYTKSGKAKTVDKAMKFEAFDEIEDGIDINLVTGRVQDALNINNAYKKTPKKNEVSIVGEELGLGTDVLMKIIFHLKEIMKDSEFLNEVYKCRQNIPSTADIAESRSFFSKFKTFSKLLKQYNYIFPQCYQVQFKE